MSGDRVISRAQQSVLLLAAGAFLLTLSLLVRLHVYPSGTALPVEQSRVIHLSAANATVFDTARLESRRGVGVEMTMARYGDALAGTGDTAVWTEFLSLTAVRGPRIDYHERRVPFDRRSGEIVDCCGAYVDADDQARPRGLAFRWPAGARPTAYQVYDPVVRRAVTARFDGIEEVAGVRAHRYVQRFVNDRIAQPALPLPGRVLGLKSRAEVPAAAFLDGRRTYWVEPASGIVVSIRENLTRTLRTADRRGEVLALAADLRTSEWDERYSAAEANAFRTWVTVTGLVVPGVLLLAGALLIGYGWRVHVSAASGASGVSGVSGVSTTTAATAASAASAASAVSAPGSGAGGEREPRRSGDSGRRPRS
ncbi:DUF3068 domain-containing protein [Streptosporangium sp. KLBMP 9127]|nr:DUF3068 domain-containing protein [Streptosporangium sp. KLBMP 9127]